MLTLEECMTCSPMYIFLKDWNRDSIAKSSCCRERSP